MERKSRARAKGRRGRLEDQLVFGYARRKGHRIGRPKEEGSGVSHMTREALASRFPVHVVMRLREGLPSLRKRAPYGVLRGCFAKGCDRFGFRLVHYSVQGNHLHLIAEARDRRALSRGMNGLNVRMARGLNRLWRRKGRVFADRYFSRILKTPLEVKRALEYVLKNAKKHRAFFTGLIDRYSSGVWFDGWKGVPRRGLEVPGPPPLAAAGTWLLRVGWRRHGLVAPV